MTSFEKFNYSPRYNFYKVSCVWSLSYFFNLLVYSFCHIGIICSYFFSLLSFENSNDIYISSHRVVLQLLDVLFTFCVFFNFVFHFAQFLLLFSSLLVFCSPMSNLLLMLSNIVFIADTIFFISRCLFWVFSYTLYLSLAYSYFLLTSGTYGIQ